MGQTEEEKQREADGPRPVKDRIACARWAFNSYIAKNPDAVSMLREEILVDLITDLFHLAKKEKFDPRKVFDRVAMHLDAEIPDEG